MRVHSWCKLWLHCSWSYCNSFNRNSIQPWSIDFVDNNDLWNKWAPWRSKGPFTKSESNASALSLRIFSFTLMSYRSVWQLMLGVNEQYHKNALYLGWYHCESRKRVTDNRCKQTLSLPQKYYRPTKGPQGQGKRLEPQSRKKTLKLLCICMS